MLVAAWVIAHVGEPATLPSFASPLVVPLADELAVFVHFFQEGAYRRPRHEEAQEGRAML